ncbi:MAG: hypothetical protein R3B48_02740 [Kofleriaceae bacterium]
MTMPSSPPSSARLRAAPGHARLAALALGCALGGGACSDDPQYLDPAMPLEGGLVDAMGEPLRAATTLTLPIGLETAEDAAARATRAAELGIDVPYVRLGDLAVSVEWSLVNLDTRPGKVRVALNGGNEFFFYDPSMITLDGGDEDAPEAPALAGAIPLDVAASGRLSGVFREDQLDELSIDLDQITRGNINPFRAVLNIDEDVTAFQPMTPFDPTMPDVMPTPLGPPIPREAIAQAIRLDLSIESSVHVMLEYAVRVRDHRGLLHDRLLAAPADEVTAFAPVLYAP